MSLYTTDSARPLGKGLQSPAGSILDRELQSMFRNYKRSTAGRYRAVVEDDFLTSLPHGELMVSPKIDGEMWFMVLDEKDAFLASPKGRVISGKVPILEEAQAALGRATGRTIIAGELFAVNKDKSRPRVGGLSSAMGGETKAQVGRMAFAAFDSLLGGDAESGASVPLYQDRLAMLERLFKGGKRAKAIRTEHVKGGPSVAQLFEKWVAGGKGEGLVIRTPENAIFKAKPTINIDAVIIGYTESSDGPEKVGSVLLALMRDDGKFHVLGSCGNMPTEQRIAFMNQLKPTTCGSEYRYANSRGALYRFVRPETIIEIKLTDIQSQDASGDPIQRMVLEQTEGKYKAVRQLPGVSILHPVFVRIRDDKGVNPTDIRLGQVLERCLVENLDSKAEKLILPVSKVIRREVYTKTVKGEVAVRKLVVWQTNKDKIDPTFPAYVTHFTDYSPGRRDPLKREVRLAPEKAEAVRIGEEMIAKQIKGGWNPVK